MSTRSSKWSHLFPKADRLLAQGIPMGDVAAALTAKPADRAALTMVLYQRRHRAGLTTRPYKDRSHLRAVTTLLLSQDLRTRAVLDWLLAGPAKGDDRAALRMMVHHMKPSGWRGLVHEVKPEHLERYAA